MVKKFVPVALVLFALAAVLSFCGGGIAHADGLVTIECPTPCPSCPVPLQPPQFEPPVSPPCRLGEPCTFPPRPMPRFGCSAYLAVKNHNVNVTIEDQLAKTHVEEIFVNDSDTQLEGTYIFPLPADAAINDFAMYVDGQKLEGQVLDREQARRIYEDIVRRRRDPALLEYIGQGAFQARIFPIPPHSEKRVEISYSQVLRNENNLVKYIYPLGTEKFSSRPLASVAINVSLRSSQALKAIYSPSHSVSVARSDDHHATIGYEAVNVRPDRDFVLYYSLSPDEIGATLLTYKPDAQSDGFFLLLVTPQVKTVQDKVIAKDVILVLDTSGSMQGEKIDQARRALKYVLGHLNPDDRFNVISFSTGVIPFAARLQAASARVDAEQFVERLSASGSTDINRGLLEALGEVDGERPAIIIFLTDGLPTVGELNPQKILDNVDRAAPSNVRLFTFGVGDDVNTVLLDSLGEKHRGTSAYVRPSEKIDETVADFYAKVSTPVLSDVTVDWGGAQVQDVYPYPLPDLFAGSQLVIAGRYHASGPITVTLTGNINGPSQSYKFEDLNLRSEGGDKFIAPLWATRKIGYLLAQIRLHGENKEAVDEIVALAVRYGILTPYTSFLIDEQNDVLTPTGRGGAAQDLNLQVKPSVIAPSGPTAVAKSQTTRGLKEANAAPNESNGQVQQIGDKAFIARDGVWVDTTFDPTQMVTTKILFGTDNYFDLLSRHPEWGAYLALGERVIFVVDGTAYEIAASQ